MADGIICHSISNKNDSPYYPSDATFVSMRFVESWQVIKSCLIIKAFFFETLCKRLKKIYNLK